MTGSADLLVFTIRRVAASVVTLVAASILIFLAMAAIGGDVASILLGQDGTPATIAALQAKLGLDQPLWSQYFSWATGLLRGDLGNSAVALAGGAESAPVVNIIGEPARNSLILASLTMLFVVPVSLGIGMLTGLNAGRRTDRSVTTVSVAMASLPEFVLAAVLTYIFFTVLGLVDPVALVPEGQSPLSDPGKLVLPILTLVLPMSAVAARQVRAGVVEAAASPYVQMAYLNGLPTRVVRRRYTLRNALPTGLQVYAEIAFWLFGGIIIVEYVYAYPGLGSQLVNSVAVRDFPMVQAVTLLVIGLCLLLMIIADIGVALLSPRSRSTK